MEFEYIGSAVPVAAGSKLIRLGLRKPNTKLISLIVNSI